MERTAAPLSRRHMLAGLAGAAVVALVSMPTWHPGTRGSTRRWLASNPLTRRFLSLANADMPEWEAQVGSDFTTTEGQRLRLVGVRPMMSRGARPPSVTRDRAFAAVFDASGGARLAGDTIYHVTHPHYGRVPIFLSATDHPARMLAVFN